jgi:carboxyl-terminal processing protease
VRKNNKLLFAAVIFLVGGTVVIGPAKVWSNAQQLYNKWMILTMILDKIQRFYVEEKNPDLLLKDAIDGMLSGLDAHSVYIPAEQAKDYSLKYQGYFGVGLTYSLINHKYIVTSLVRNGPAANAGVIVGDRIQKIEGRSVADMAPEQVEQFLSGNADSHVELDVLRPLQNELLHFDLTKRQIDINSISAVCMLDRITGYIQISYFSDSTPTELDYAFAELDGLGMTQLLLDLRDNSGGALEAGVAVADRLIPPGKLIVFTQGRAPQASEQFISTASVTLPSFPLIVLVNEKTASDAEIVAGAVQDWDRGIIVGRQTYGKALVQTEYPFQDGSILLLTTARYYTPLGRLIQNDNQDNKLTQESRKEFRTPKGRTIFAGGGIRPDFELKKSSKTISTTMRKFRPEGENYFYQFADDYLISTPREAMPKNLNDFLHLFAVTDDLFRRFAELTVERSENRITRMEIEQNRSEIMPEIKVALAWRLWGEEGRNAASACVDDEVLKSLSYFSKAAGLIAK